MKTLYLITIISIITGILVLNHEMKYSSETLDKVIFNAMSFLFLGIFAYYGYNNGTTYGLQLSLFLWAFFVCTVPIPQVALLLSLPLKQFFDITVFMSQAIISLLALGVLLFYYCCNARILHKHPIGKVFDRIMNKHLYLIFFISITASIVGSHLIDVFVDIYMYKQETNEDQLVLLASMLFLLLNTWYMNYSIEHNLKII